MKQKREQLLREISTVKEELKKLPKGELCCRKNGKYTKWYVKTINNELYLPRSEKKEAEQLAYRKYLECRLEDLEKELSAVERYLKHCATYEHKKAPALLEKEPFRELLKGNFETDDQRIKNWLREEYRTNPWKPEKLIYKTVAGHMVRSKSEAIIAAILYANHIPYRYECELILGDHVVYPDFTIMHPKTYRIYYLEHFGMMDIPYYINRACEKIRSYAENNIIPTFDLLITYETSDKPINAEYVENLIRDYFLRD